MIITLVWSSWVENNKTKLKKKTKQKQNVCNIFVKQNVSTVVDAVL